RERADVGGLAGLQRAALAILERGVGFAPTQHAQRLIAADGVLGVPIGTGEALQIVAVHGGVELDQRLAALDRRIGAGGDDSAGIEQRLPGVGAGEAARAETRWREVE